MQLKKIIFLIIGFVLFHGCAEEKKDKSISAAYKEQIKNELDSIYKADQKYRAMLQDTSDRYGWDSPQMKNLWENQKKLDSVNLIKVLQIINNINTYPGDSIVGYPTRKAAFFVLQHSPDSIQDQYLPMIIKAGKTGQLDENLAAMYHDRYLLHRDLPQIYGSQYLIITIKDSVTGKEKKVHELYPIKDTAKVDSLRRSAGMIPLDEYKRLSKIKD
ncbi:DUF6624 domain-containing protein [Christiangramia sp. SM2212]|uniref:Lipoprotein n=1 Tax=Christiangramia sediminicola TaxID=3073267 RepID=A0ABU1ENF4_9FLAO|nr:DUF6624 domain-containing protein [Christiangramia sp. SM2212]MDR5589924.1 hypothetical protein [Christiangramia sp. SM2212]